ncbi:MAG: aldehyde dehydrogenase family protein, partial [Burkholderiales bacterium]
MAIESINPATGERLKTYEEMPRGEVEDILDKTHEAFLAWRWKSFEERGQRMRAAAQVLRNKAETYAR